MATNLAIDPELLRKALQVSGMTMLTTDADFRHAAKHVPLRVWGA